MKAPRPRPRRASPDGSSGGMRQTLERNRESESDEDMLADVTPERLRVMVLEALKRPKARKATKPSRGAKRRRLKAKRQNSEKKNEHFLFRS